MLKPLLFIRHAQVVQNTAVASTHWQLSADGRSASQRLAQQVSPAPTLVFTSSEDKAIATGQIMAAVWGVPCRVAASLHEHERRHNSYFPDAAAFRTAVANFLTHPTELVFGSETAQQAALRLQTAVADLLAKHPDERLAIVTHGRILTALLSATNPALDAVAFWQQLKLPDTVWVQSSDFVILEG